MMQGPDSRSTVRVSNILGKHSFLFQPLLFALFCILLVTAFFVTALMDVRRTQNTLMGVFENKGLTIIETVESIAVDKFRRLEQTTSQNSDLLQNFEYMDEGFQLQEAILGRLIELAREVDRRVETNQLSGSMLEKLAVDTSMQAIIVYGETGESIQKSAPIPETSAAGIRHLLEESAEIGVNFQGKTVGRKALYLVTVRRNNKEGSIALVFGSEGFHYWATRVATQRAIDEGGWKKGVDYFMVLDTEGLLLAGAGDLPEALANGYVHPMIEQMRVEEDRTGHRISAKLPTRLEVYAPLQINGIKVGMARIGLGIEDAVRLRETHQQRIFVTTGVMMLGAVLVMLLYYRIQNRHMRRINTMKEKLYQAERLASLGKLAAGVAHEVRNPLNAISMAVQRIQREYRPAESQGQKEFLHIVSVVREEINRLNLIIEDFVGPTRLKRVDFRLQPLLDLLDQVVRLAREEADLKGISIELKCQKTDLVISMDSVRMHQALFNLIKNSLESMDTPGTITVTSRQLAHRQAVISIRDTGCGIPADILKRIFDFEYTTKEKGLGLGLPIANEIIEAHGGKMLIQSTPGEGTVIELTLPIQSKL